MPRAVNGWHPYLAFPSGQRAQVRLRLPAARRIEVSLFTAE